MLWSRHPDDGDHHPRSTARATGLRSPAMLTDVLGRGADYAFYIADLYNEREDGKRLSNQTEAFRAYNWHGSARSTTLKPTSTRPTAARR